LVKINQTHAQDLLAQDDQYVWHSMKPYSPASTMVIKEAKGAWITDIEGNRYLDGMSGLWCVNVGYGRKELAEAAYEQLKELAYFPLTQSHVPAIKLAEKLNKWLGDEYVIFFSNSGSEANETAFNIARQYHAQRGDSNRYKIVSRYRSYHGNTMGSLAATGQAQRKYKYEPLAPGFVHVAPPDTYRMEDAQSEDAMKMRCVKDVPFALREQLRRSAENALEFCRNNKGWIRYTEVSFENLLQNPETEIQRISAFLNIPYQSVWKKVVQPDLNRFNPS
jgi:taurine-pyruvate aminotransferase